MESKACILVVDDVEQNRLLVGTLVRSLGYDVETASDGHDALARLADGIDLVLLDVMMPGLSGYDVVRRMRREPQWSDLPVIMVTALDSREDRVQAVAAGANDFIAKPVDKTELLVRIGSQLRLKEAQDALKRHRAELERTVEERTAELRHSLEETAAAQRRTWAAHVDTIRRLVLAAEFKDRNTAEHIQRISHYSALLARIVGVPADEIEVLRHAATMHDVGKIGVPDAILLKEGPLNAEERRVMEAHTVIGSQLLAGSSSELLQAGEVIALTHHEKWDGTGYPRRLVGEEIPLWGRICALVDVFDALTTHRPYRRALSNAQALAILREGRGSHFDPELLAAFERNLEEFYAQQEGFSTLLRSRAAGAAA
jgi:putative two-component system response regulator